MGGRTTVAADVASAACDAVDDLGKERGGEEGIDGEGDGEEVVVTEQE